jgi:hypothetical protein
MVMVRAVSVRHAPSAATTYINDDKRNGFTFWANKFLIKFLRQHISTDYKRKLCEELYEK